MSSAFDQNNREFASGTYVEPLGWNNCGNSLFSYDENGNLSESQIAGNTHSQICDQWDARNRLKEIDSGNNIPPNIVSAFTYDAFGRRISKTDSSGNTTTYLYDGQNPIEEIHSGTSQSILTGLNVDERYARDDANLGRTYFLTDALGSTLALTDTGGTVQETYSYSAYGEVTATGSSDNPYQYMGRENDGTGLYYYRARYYSPTLKRFISEDPMALKAGLNTYAYTDADPVNEVDPSGMETAGPWTFPPGPDRDNFPRLPFRTPCQILADDKFLVNLIPIVGTAYGVYELLNDEGGPGDMVDSGGGTLDAAGEGIKWSAGRTRFSRYRKQQKLFNMASDAKRGLLPYLKAVTCTATMISWALNATDYYDALKKCDCEK